jgi:hypothetical protein
MRYSQAIPTILALLVLAISIVACGSESSSGGAANSSGNVQTLGDAYAACFPGWSQSQILNFLGSLSSYLSRDSFGDLAIQIKMQAKCTSDIAFAMIWEIYQGASQKMNHPIISKDTAWSDFSRNWR